MNHDTIVDGRHLLHRSSSAHSVLSTKVDGEEIPTGGVYGFLSVVARVKQRHGGRIRVAWEGDDNFRFKLFPGYKTRDDSESEEERRARRAEIELQERLLREILTACGVEQVEGRRCEADDVLGTLAARNRYAGKNTLVYTGDSDLTQVVRDEGPGLGWIRVVAPAKRSDVVYDEAAVFERFGVAPNRIAHLKAIAGDNSDKIPGAPGLGPVAAAKILEAFGGLPEAIAFAREERGGSWPGTTRQLVIFRDAADDMELYLKLTNIRVKVKTYSTPGKADRQKLRILLKRYRFASLLAPLEFNALSRLG